MRKQDIIACTGAISKEKFACFEPEWRLQAILADGNWYSLLKLAKASKNTVPYVEEWVKERIPTGEIIRSENEESYRWSTEAILKFFKDNNMDYRKPFLGFTFRSRIWDGLNENEIFENAPLREICMVNVTTDNQAFISDLYAAMKGVGRIREVGHNKYRIYGLSTSYIKTIVQKTAKKYVDLNCKITVREVSYRRELADLPKEALRQMVGFYADFARLTIRKPMETIEIFIPSRDDQDTQIVLWVLSALEKFDGFLAVPFSGYLDRVLHYWPYNLPPEFLGKDLSDFQRGRSKVIKKYKKMGVDYVTSEQIAKELGITIDEYNDLYNSHKNWLKYQGLTTLTWCETSEEKRAAGSLFGERDNEAENSELLENDETAMTMAAEISRAIVETALETSNFTDTFTLIEMLSGGTQISPIVVGSLSKDYRNSFIINYQNIVNARKKEELGEHVDEKIVNKSIDKYYGKTTDDSDKDNILVELKNFEGEGREKINIIVPGTKAAKDKEAQEGDKKEEVKESATFFVKDNGKDDNVAVETDNPMLSGVVKKVDSLDKVKVRKMSPKKRKELKERINQKIQQNEDKKVSHAASQNLPSIMPLIDKKFEGMQKDKPKSKSRKK